MNDHLLIDSHVLVWLLYEPERLGTSTKNLIESAGHVYVSVVSLWELSLKFRKGKLPYTPDDFTKGVEALGLTILLLETHHFRALTDVHLPHDDPFDAMLVAQNVAEGCTFLTADKAILGSQYATHDVSS